ncbi:MAG: hypothetical protein U1E16_04670 [Hyphomicrobiales bacterium]
MSKASRTSRTAPPAVEAARRRPKLGCLLGDFYMTTGTIDMDLGFSRRPDDETVAVTAFRWR